MPFHTSQKQTKKIAMKKRNINFKSIPTFMQQIDYTIVLNHAKSCEKKIDV